MHVWRPVVLITRVAETVRTGVGVRRRVVHALAMVLRLYLHLGCFKLLYVTMDAGSSASSWLERKERLKYVHLFTLHTLD